MTIGTLSSVFQRIDAIEARFARTPRTPAGPTAVAPGTDFDSLLARSTGGADVPLEDLPTALSVDQLASMGALLPSASAVRLDPSSLYGELDRLAAAGALPVGQSARGVTADTSLHTHATSVGTIAGASVGSASAPLPGPGGSVAPDTPFATEFERAGLQHGVPPRLLAAVGWVESRYQIDAVSPDGALGIMQFMPMTAQELGVDPYDPIDAIDGAARLLAQHQRKFGSWDLALAAYHSGAGAVARAGDQPPPRAATYVELVHQRLENA